MHNRITQMEGALRALRALRALESHSVLELIQDYPALFEKISQRFSLEMEIILTNELKKARAELEAL